MRILEFGKFYWPERGGIETLLRSWCEGFVRLGAEVDCVVANRSPRTTHENLNGVRVHRLASWGTVFSTSLCPGYPASARRYPADLWHAHFPNPLMDLACLAGGRRTPLVITYHSDVIRQAALMTLYRPLLRRLLARADRIVVATPNHLRYCSALAPYLQKCRVIPFGINQEPLQPAPATLASAAELRKGAGGRAILLNIGRLVGYKGQKYLIEAARELDADVWLVGSGPLEAPLRAQASACGMGERVRFWGAVGDSQIPALLHACDLFVLPSITPNEAFGLAQVEAMACGKPVVSCALASGVPYVNQDGVTGVIVPPADAPALAAALRKLLHDRAWRENLGEAGRLRAAREFGEAVMVERYWDCLRETLAENNRR